MAQPSRRYQRNSPPGKQLTITLPPTILTRIDALAKAKNTSLSAVIVRLLRTALGLPHDEDEERAA